MAAGERRGVHCVCGGVLPERQEGWEESDNVSHEKPGAKGPGISQCKT